MIVIVVDDNENIAKARVRPLFNTNDNKSWAMELLKEMMEDLGYAWEWVGEITHNDNN